MSESRITSDRESIRRSPSENPSRQIVTPFFRLLPPLLFVIVAITPVRADPVSISFDQTAVFPGWYDARLSLISPFLDGAFAFRGGERLAPPDDFLRAPAIPCSDPEPRYWNLTARPLRFCAITAGSLSVSGLPARAKNPFFTLTDPRHTPLTPTNGPIVRAGETLDSDNLAVECSTAHWKMAAAGSPRAWLDAPAWILASAFLGSPEAREGKLSVTALYGAKNVEARNDTAWFREDPYRPRATVTVMGGEAVFSYKGVSSSATALTSSGPFRDAEWLVRSDFFLSGRHASLSGGFSRSSAGFTPLDGKEEPYLCRAFLAPALALGNHQAGKRGKILGSTHAGVSVGGIAIRDVERRERFYLDDREVFALGGYCAMSVFALDIESECLSRDGMTDLEGKFRAGTARFPLALAVSAKTTVPNAQNGFSLRENSKVSAGIAWKSGIFGQTSRNSGHSRGRRVRKATLEAAFSGTQTRMKPGDSPDHSIGMALSLGITGPRLRVRALTEVTYSTGDSPWEGKIGLETTLR